VTVSGFFYKIGVNVLFLAVEEELIFRDNVNPQEEMVNHVSDPQLLTKCVMNNLVLDQMMEETEAENKSQENLL
jgi:hypothetical protein